MFCTYGSVRGAASNGCPYRASKKEADSNQGDFTGIVLAASEGEGIRRAFFNTNHVE